jgi:hypothetical protein
MGNEHRTTLVLGQDFEPERLERFLTDRKWTRVARDVKGEGGGQIVEEVWASLGDTHAVHYVDDRTMLTRYLWVRGGEIMSIVSELVSHFFIHPPDELLQDVADAKTVRELVNALYHLAVGNRDRFDEAALEVYRYYSQDEHPAVRHAVIQSLLFTNWKQGAEILDKMAAEDPKPDLREHAARTADPLRRAEAGP